MNNKLLLDTDVLIEYLRGKNNAAEYLESLEDEALLSVITIAELYAGTKDQSEKNALDDFFKIFTIIPVDYSIAKLGGELKKQYGKSHGTGLADALIAATAIKQNATLISFNTRHFPMLNAKSPYARAPA
jgi:predicted nucleic acid-binding protein